MTNEQACKAQPLKQTARFLLNLCGVLFLLLVCVGLTGLPRSFTRWLAGGEPSRDAHPSFVIVLGGGGIPSESGLLRTYCAAAAYGADRTGVTFIVALPSDGDPATNSVGRMRDELVLRGIPAASIRMEYRGRNTREQALNVRRMLGPRADDPVVLVTSPYHVRRSVLCFRKHGFRRVTGLPASSVGAEADLGGWETLRYTFWNNLISEIEAVRELAALAQYRLKGWI